MTPRVWSKRAPKYPALAVYIGRPSKWGNPFCLGRDGNRKEVIAKYRIWVLEQFTREQIQQELRGKHMLCWCAPQACHGDVLLEISNSDE